MLSFLISIVASLPSTISGPINLATPEKSEVAVYYTLFTVRTVCTPYTTCLYLESISLTEYSTEIGFIGVSFTSIITLFSSFLTVILNFFS